MTDHEAQKILNEHRAENPIFVRGTFQYTVRPDGKVEMWKAIGKSGRRWAYWLTVGTEDFWMLPKEVRERAEA